MGYEMENQQKSGSVGISLPTARVRSVLFADKQTKSHSYRRGASKFEIPTVPQGPATASI